jgi:hypothetical protein
MKVAQKAQEPSAEAREIVEAELDRVTGGLGNSFTQSTGASRNSAGTTSASSAGTTHS